MAKNFYAVYKGRKTGIFTKWPDVAKLVNGFDGARYKGFETRDEAQNWMDDGAPKPTSVNGKKSSKTTRNSVVLTPDSIQVWTDGGSRNHGNVKGGHVLNEDTAAWAFYIKTPGETFSGTDGEKGKTNNYMEITAFLQAIKKLIDLGLREEHIVFILDSKYVLNAIEKKWLAGWQRRDWKKADGQTVLNVELWQQVAELLPALTHVDFEWTKGHADNEGNNKVDELLNETMDQM
ncbi:ribonuclease H family protein [Dellaglioa algida]|nr:ribonuclease H family protein [Dellaglioa algida]MDK1732182.1 ribonuclease H family protein [Dellaglioa algida]MDK1733708.1 ribonuclease H family protein [Dellaglioa algida]